MPLWRRAALPVVCNMRGSRGQSATTLGPSTCMACRRGFASRQTWPPPRLFSSPNRAPRRAMFIKPSTLAMTGLDYRQRLLLQSCVVPCNAPADHSGSRSSTHPRFFRSKSAGRQGRGAGSLRGGPHRVGHRTDGGNALEQPDWQHDVAARPSCCQISTLVYVSCCNRERRKPHAAFRTRTLNGLRRQMIPHLVERTASRAMRPTDMH